jgi:hypothetical protein
MTPSSPTEGLIILLLIGVIILMLKLLRYSLYSWETSTVLSVLSGGKLNISPKSIFIVIVVIATIALIVRMVSKSKRVQRQPRS